MAENFGAFVRRVRATGVVQLPINTIDCSANPNWPAGTQGDVYRVTGAGKIGGASGKVVQVGDILVCHTTAVTGTDAAVGSNWVIQQANIVSTADVPASTDKNYVTDAQLVVIGNTSGTNTGDQVLPVKASGAEVTTGTDDAKFATAKAIKDAGIVATPVKASGAELDTGTDDAKFATAKALADSNYLKGAQQLHIADPAGGVTQDAEARAAIASILDALE